MSDNERVCSERECGQEFYARTLCRRHYRRRKYHGTLPPRISEPPDDNAINWSHTLTRDPLDLHKAPAVFINRFWSKVQIGNPDECWPWMASTKIQGYGQFYIRKGVPVTASRVALALQGHVLTRDIEACHTCDNPPCCNPNHLFPGSYTDNNVDCIQKGRANRSHGSDHKDAHLTEEIVRELRRNAPYKWGEYAELGRRYGMTSDSVRRAILGMTWKHVDA